MFSQIVLPDNKPLYKGIPRPPTKLKIVCDTMLQGLGRQLRNCGVDTAILEAGDDYQKALQVSDSLHSLAKGFTI